VSRSASDDLLLGGAVAPFEGWSVVSVKGLHRERFLNSQLTSDVGSLNVGASQMTALLDRSGRVQTFGFLLKREDEIVLLLPEDSAAAAVAMLESHVIADDVRFRFVETPPKLLVLGAEAVLRLQSENEETTFPVEAFGSRGYVSWAGTEVDLPAMSPQMAESLRVLSGLPRWGQEVSGGTLVHETTLVDQAVSSDKGCYLGQETVAKVASGRGAARAPMLLEVVGGSPNGADMVGETFSTDLGKRSGKVISRALWNEAVFLQAAVIRELRVKEREIECRFEGGANLKVRIHSLPYLSLPAPDRWARRLELEAVAAFSADREDEAIELYRRAVAVCPWYADAYEGLGVILGRHRRFEEAIELMHRLLEVDPSSVMAHTNLSLYYNQLGRIEDAEREAAEAMRAKMRSEFAAREIPEPDQDEQDAAAADRERRAEMFRQVLALDADDAVGNFGLGELLVEEGRYGEAIAHLERALAADPRYSAALLALGRAHEGAEDLESARSTYRNGIDTAAARGDLATANKMQERLASLGPAAEDSNVEL
jgi:folate-binding protein YgfZ